MQEDFYLIGDVHLGKRFRSKDIPLDKRGVREQLLKAQFLNLVNKAIASVQNKEKTGVIIMGDLFDSFCVSYEDVFFAKQVLNKFNEDKVPCYVLAGNHDGSKDSSRVSAFVLLEQLMYPIVSVNFIRDGVSYLIKKDERYLLVPYVHGKTYQELLEPFVDKKFSTYVFGHFEEPYTDWLKSNFTHIYTGHVHTPRIEDNVTVVGSIMPFTFAEDPTNSFMKTCTLSEYESDLASGVSLGKCYRLKLKEGEELPADPVCLQMSVYRENAKNESEDLEVAFEEFDLEKLMHEALDDLNLYDEIYEIYSTQKMAEVSE